MFTHHNGHAIIGRNTSRDIGYVHFPATECPPLSMALITHAIQTLQQHVETPIVTHKDTILHHDKQHQAQASHLQRLRAPHFQRCI